VYCDGGMCNDFPMNSLPDDGHRLGLMVRPKDWYMYNFGSLHRLKKGSSTKEEEDQVNSNIDGSRPSPLAVFSSHAQRKQTQR
jgi:hypothetical protein